MNIFKKIFKRKPKQVVTPLHIIHTELNFEKLKSCCYVPFELISNSITPNDIEKYVRHKLAVQIADAIENRLQLYEKHYDNEMYAMYYATMIRINFDGEVIN